MIPTVSIVLPTFNRLQFLREAVDSVLAHRPIEIGNSSSPTTGLMREHWIILRSSSNSLR